MDALKTELHEQLLKQTQTIASKDAKISWLKGVLITVRSYVYRSPFETNSQDRLEILALLDEALAAPATPTKEEPVKISTGFNYTVSYDGGIGPDVLDTEASISAVDIHDAVSQARQFEEDSGAWVFTVSQEDYPLTTRQKLEDKIRALEVALSYEQELGGRHSEQREIYKKALESITRNQSEKPDEEGICPFGCDAPWIAMSALGIWKHDSCAAWTPTRERITHTFPNAPLRDSAAPEVPSQGTSQPPIPPEGYEIYEPKIVEQGSLVRHKTIDTGWLPSALAHCGGAPCRTNLYARPIKPTPTQASTGICDKCGETVAISRLTLGNPLSICEDCLTLPQAETGAGETPRTDAKIIAKHEYGDWGAPDVCNYVSVSFAQQLERELAEAKSDAARYSENAQAHANEVIMLEDQLAVALREVEELKRHEKDAITALGKMDGIMMENARLSQRDAHVRQELEKLSKQIQSAWKSLQLLS